MRARKYVKTARGYEPVIREEDVLGAIRTFLEVNGARVFRSIERVPKCYRCGCWLGSSERGISDLWGWFERLWLIDDGTRITRLRKVIKPIHFFIEVKRPGGKLRPAQEAFLEQAQADGIIAFKADSLEAVVQGFKDRQIVLRGI